MEEVRYFGRLSLYAIIVGIAYWFLSYEPAGTVLLLGFGLATGAAFLVLRSGAHGASPAGGVEGAGAPDEAHAPAPDGPFADESGPVPTRSGAPLAVGFGVAAVALAGAFGAWFLIAGAVPLLLGAADWLRSAERELALRSSADEAAGARGADGSASRFAAPGRGPVMPADGPATPAPPATPPPGAAPAGEAQPAADASSRR